MKTPVFFKDGTAGRKAKRPIQVAILLFLAASVTACKKELKDEQGSLAFEQGLVAIPTPVFDWETADHMPTPPGVQPVLVPWASGSNQLFPSDIAFDFKRKDGWNMVYNTFSTTSMPSPGFFALYNKYTGILRFYLYMPPGAPIPSSYFSDGLSLSGPFRSSLLNFSKDVAEANTIPVRSVTRIQNYQLQSTGAWYACQYEMAYDPNVANATQDNLNFVWNLATANVSAIKLNGTVNGSLSGTIGVETQGGFNVGNLFGEVVKGAVYAAGLYGVGQLKIGKEVKEAMTDGAKSGLSGAVKGFLSAILGGSPSSPELVNLTLKTDIELGGTLSSNSGIANPTLAVPGTKSGKHTVGYVPAYNKVLGVVHVRRMPVVYTRIDSSRTFRRIGGRRARQFRTGYHCDYELSYTHDQDNILYNPEVLKDGTTIKLLRSDIVIPYKINEDRIKTASSLGNKYWHSENVLFEEDFGVPTYHAKEDIGIKSYIVGGSQNADVRFKVLSRISTSMYFDIENLIDYQNTAIRYTFLVTPPDGGKKYTIVKTFRANLWPIANSSRAITNPSGERSRTR